MDFNFASTPQLQLGPGKVELLPSVLKSMGSHVLLVTGKASFCQTDRWEDLIAILEREHITWDHYIIPGEPSPQMVDKCVMESNFDRPDAVAAIGGGSVLDAGKAISAMWEINESVRLYLEGVGDGRKHPGTKIPFIAVPTTSGTGSEATKNAVISEVGKNGFKKSLRHHNFIPDLAIVDPLLTVDCPPEITAWSGMDAFTQLLESYLSTQASPLTDAIALSGLQLIAKSLEKVVHEPDNLTARSDMAYASFCSGLTLANAGLGVVHGFASSIGGRFNIPHGLICGTLMGAANEFTLNALLKMQADGKALGKYADIGKIFYGSDDRDDVFYAEFLINKIHDLTEDLALPGLGVFGLERNDIRAIAEKTSCKYNPVNHNQDELVGILERRI